VSLCVAAAPRITGDLQFNEIGFTVTTLNASFQSMNDKISFANDAITFNRFTIKDQKTMPF
jgi:autotransporter translocation and assembly factor TamB